MKPLQEIHVLRAQVYESRRNLAAARRTSAAGWVFAKSRPVVCLLAPSLAPPVLMSGREAKRRGAQGGGMAYTLQTICKFFFSLPSPSGRDHRS